MSSSCPFCYIEVPLSDLEWHANEHILEEELAKDMALAQEIAFAPPSPLSKEKPVISSMPYEVSFGCLPESSTSISHFNSRNYGDKLYQDKISCLVSLQTRNTFYKVEGGLMSLLKKCLEKESENSISIISGYIDHFQSISSEDSGWGCGWRNIQMLSSHLLVERQEASELLFGGSGFVPDIPSLQRWLEIAWERGFDIPGSKSFDHKIYGTRKWIGTTECATILRSFGLLARVVDFEQSKSIVSPVNSSNTGVQNIEPSNSGPKGKRKTEQVYGPMDKFLSRTNHSGLDSGHGSKNELGYAYHGLSGHQESHHIRSSHNADKWSRKINDQQVLPDWVWNYFSKDVSGGLTDSQHVFVTEKTPLYFQHDGHSRTIVGIQMQKGHSGMPDRYLLLILDPSQRSAALEKSLKGNAGWQKLIKRGVHTLKKTQYQLCYVDPGIAHGEEIEQLKRIDSVLIKM